MRDHWDPQIATGETLTITPLRLVRAAATGPPFGQQCLDFLPAVVVCHEPRKRGAGNCAAPHPVPAFHQLLLEARQRPPATVRAKALKLYDYQSRRGRDNRERVTVPGDRPRAIMTRALTQGERDEMTADVRSLTRSGVYRLRPQHGNGIDGDCPPAACAWISCRHHLKYEVDPVSGTLRDNWPGVDWDEMRETCSLRVAETVADTGQHMEFDEVGLMVNLTDEWVRRIAGEGMRKMRANVSPDLADPTED